MISTKQAVDYEEHEFIQFVARAEDQGTPSQTGTTLVNIWIEDLNDMHPGFICVNRAEDDPYPDDQPCFYNLELRSDVDIGHSLVQFVAIDDDSRKAKENLLK
jgi:hypothetical protein